MNRRTILAGLVSITSFSGCVLPPDMTAEDCRSFCERSDQKVRVYTVGVGIPIVMRHRPMRCECTESAESLRGSD
jgi:hypothetical protein